MLFKQNCIPCLFCRVYLIVLMTLKAHTFINSVVQTKLFSLFDLQGLFTSLTEIKFFYLHTFIHCLFFMVYSIVLLKIKEQTYMNSVVQTKLHSLLILKGLFNKFANIKLYNLYYQRCSSKTVFIV